MKSAVNILNTKILHNGFYKLHEVTLEHKKHDGSWSAPIKREIFSGAHVATILPYDPSVKKIILIDQFRPGILNENHNPVIKEIVAGIIDDGESPQEAAIRECKEEIDCDIHRLTKLKKLYLGGLKIPAAHGLEGHSDADPVLHALIDALLGACRLGDIGKLFSNKNKKYKNIRSTLLLKKVINLIKSKNFLINNIDINVITQEPKIKKYSKEMIYTISKICGINISQINIKGKTAEKFGLIGKGKAIASEVIASVNKHDR